MQPIDIKISNHIEVKLDMLPEEKREKHLQKANEIGKKIINAKDAGRKSVVISTMGFKKSLIKKILLEILPEVAFRICSLIPGVLRIVL